jgi:hypothetical protein
VSKRIVIGNRVSADGSILTTSRLKFLSAELKPEKLTGAYAGDCRP